MSKITSSDAMDLVTLSKAENKVGDYKWSALGETAFADEHLGQWMLCDGRSCVGTRYETLTGSTTVPNAFTDGAFIRQAKSGRATGSKEAQDFKSFRTQSPNVGSGYSHDVVVPKTGTSEEIFTGREGGTTAYAPNFTWDDSEVRPVNIALNLYVKVGY